jgi:hypothetical protein
MFVRRLLVVLLLCIPLLIVVGWRPDHSPERPVRRPTTVPPPSDPVPSAVLVSDRGPAHEPDSPPESQAVEVPVVPEPTRDDPVLVLDEARRLADEAAIRLSALEELETRLEAQAVTLSQAEAERTRAEASPQQTARTFQAYRNGPVLEQQRWLESLVKREERNVKFFEYHAKWAEVLDRHSDDGRVAHARESVKTATRQLAKARQNLREFVDYVEYQQKAALESALDAAAAEIAYRREVLLREQASRDELLRQREQVALSTAEQRAVVALDDAIRLANAGLGGDARSRLDEARQLWDGENERRSKSRIEGHLSRVSESAGGLRAPPAAVPH